MVDRYTRFVSRRRWVLAGVWVLLLGIAGALSAPLPSLLSGGGWTVPGSDSAHVAAALEDGFEGRGPSSVTIVVHDQWYDATQPGFAPRVARVVEEVAADPDLDVRSQVGYTTTTGDLRSSYVGDDGHTAVEVLGLGLDDGMARQVLPDVQSALTAAFADEGLDVSLVGTASFWGEVNHLSEKGLAHAELLTLPLIILVLLLIFRGLVPALMALAVGVTAIVSTFAVLAMVAEHVELSLFVQNTATMLGLGVGVDYSLFVIARFTEELRRGRTVDEAISATLRTSGETVLFSGVTIVAAMSTLFLVPLGVISSIALGAVLVVAASMLSALLLLPVLLRLFGPRLARRGRRVVETRSGSHRAVTADRWQRLTRQVMARPVVFLTVGVAFLLALALPTRALSTFTPDAQIVPTSSPVRQGYDEMQRSFGAGSTSPVRVLVEADRPFTADDSSALTDLVEELGMLRSVDRVDSALPLLAAVSPEAPLTGLDPAVRGTLPADLRTVVGHYVSDDAERIVLDVIPAGRASDEATKDLLVDVREVADGLGLDGVRTFVGGETAEGVESNAVIQDKLPLVIAVMLAVIYLLLLVTFRSVLLPLKAIAMNLVSVAATFGVLVLVFQDGIGAGLLGIEGDSAIQNFVPVLLLTLLFSLSTDYEVFLLNRVREHYRESGDNTASVAAGMASTAPLISGAALLMVVVFGAFALAGILPIKQLGFGMAVAIAIDATIVRLLLVPASMRLMGSLNWWAPRIRRPRRVSETPLPTLPLQHVPAPAPHLVETR